jgi:hypothetical protein
VPLADTTSTTTSTAPPLSDVDLLPLASGEPRTDLVELLFQRLGRTPTSAQPIELVEARPATTQRTPPTEPDPLGLPERPWEASDAELAEVIGRLPQPMAAAAIAAGVLGPLQTPSQPLRAHAAWPAIETSTPSRPSPPAPRPTPPLPTTPSTTGVASHSRLTTRHVPSPGVAPRAVSAPAPGTSTTAAASATATAAASAGLARAPINRALDDPPAANDPAAAPSAAPLDETGQQHMDRLADEIFDRIRWRLAIERERHMA